MSNKARKDAIKHAAKLHLSGEQDAPSAAVGQMAHRMAERRCRLSLVRESRRQTRTERSLRRRAEQWQQGERKRLAEALVEA